MPGWRHTDPFIGEEALSERIAAFALKFAWFAKHGYVPHYFQALFHTATKADILEMGLCRFRHLVAGRRGGKTMSAAWEVVYYCLHPEEFHWDYHRRKDTRGVKVWVVTKDFPTGHAALTEFRECLRKCGAEYGVDYKEHKGNHWFEFANGSFVHFRSAEDPQSLRGAGLDILWMDEAAFIPNRDAYDVARPALSDKVGMVITTTTPDGKNWLWETFFDGGVLNDGQQARIEYRSIDNPYFSEEEWLYLSNPENYHPMLFRREFMAAFDAMAGKDLHGEWLRYWTDGDIPPGSSDVRIPRVKDRPDEFDLDLYIGVDPAISLNDAADRFVISLIGVTRDDPQHPRPKTVYLLEQWAGRIDFPDQIDMIREWAYKYHPLYIAVEVQAYQRAIEHQLYREDGLLNIVPMWAKGKKEERIMSMAPSFKSGRVRIHRKHADFINEWVDYDATKKNPHDDCLDSVEIALRAAGVLLAATPQAAQFENPQKSLEELAWGGMPKAYGQDDVGMDEHLGGEW